MRSLAMLLAVAAAYVLLRGLPSGWPEIVRGCAAVLALVAGLGIWGRRRPGDGELIESRRPVGGLDYGAIGLAVLAMECLLLAFLSLAPERLEAAAAQVGDWLRPSAAVERPEPNGPRRARPGNWLWNDERHRPLPRRTNFNPGNRPEIFIEPASAPDTTAMLGRRLYVQAFALSRYGGGGWSAFPGEAETLRAGNDGWLRFEDRGGQAISCRIYQGPDQDGRNPLTGLQGLVAAKVGEVTRYDEGLALLPVEQAGWGGYEYDTISRPLTLDDLDGTETAGRQPVPSEWRELPDEPLRSRLVALTQRAAGNGPLVERLRRVRDHLRTSLEYSLSTENKDDLDPLENFLFRERRGHCEYFATAGALMARICGAPSRVAYGWVGGTYYESSDLFVFRAREAHAWTEVWIDGRGWVILDPTPAAALEHATPAVAPPDEKPPGSEVLTTDEAGPAGGAPVWRAALLLVLVFGVPGGGLLLWRGWARRPRARRSGIDLDGRDPGYARMFVEACRRRGIPVVPGTTLRCLAGRLEQAPEFAAQLVRYHYSVRYEGQARDEALERDLKGRVERWSGGRNE